MIRGIIFMGKSRIMSMGGLLWESLGRIVDCLKKIWRVWYVLVLYKRTQPNPGREYRRGGGGGACN